MTVIDTCNRRCGANWFRYCAKMDCQYFDQMLVESENTKTKMSFTTIGDKEND